MDELEAHRRHRALDPNQWSSAQERIIVQLIHWGVVVLVVIAVAALAFTGHLDKASSTALLGTVLGHAGTAAATKSSARAQSPGGER